MDTDHGEKTTERPDQPHTKPRTEARTASTLLGDESTSEKKCKKRQETLHRGADWGSIKCCGPKKHEETV